MSNSSSLHQVDAINGVTTVRCQVTPQMAEQLLMGNTQNRALRMKRVEEYADEMSGGHWRYTHQGIAIDKNGVIVDGQHRLHAIILSGSTIDINVTRGLDPSVRLVVDDHAKRTAFDAITVDGGFSDITRETVSIANAFAQSLFPGGRRSMNKRQLVEVLTLIGPSIRFSEALCKSRARGLTQASVMAVLSRAWYTQDHDKILRFWEVLSTGEMRCEDDVAAIPLRTYLMTMQSGGHLAKHEAYQKTQRSLQAFLAGERLRRCVSASKELFPTPHDKSVTLILKS